MNLDPSRVQPVFPAGPPSWPMPDEDIRAALEAAYHDGSWGRYEGPHCERLMARLAERHAVRFAFLCSSGTFAVELAVRVLKLTPGDEVILGGYDFAGNFRAIEEAGLRPVLVDINPATWCLDAERIESAIGDQTRAMIVSHLHGGLAPMAEIRDLADRRGLFVVEDACQSPGAIVAGRPAGSWGDVGVLSFGGSKLLTAGRGGAILTANPTLHQRAKIICERGNHAFPLSELQAAVLLPQLEKLDERNARRRASVAVLLDGLQSHHVPLRRDVVDLPGTPVYYKLAWLFEPALWGHRCREQFVAAVQAEGVALDAGFRGFAQRASRSRVPSPLEHSLRAARDTVLLHHPVLLEHLETMPRLVEAICKATRS